MPIHDWTRVNAGIFHDFHHAWIDQTKRVLNRRLLPSGHYALAEHLVVRRGPEFLTLKQPASGEVPSDEPGGGVALAGRPPRVRFHAIAEIDWYAEKANAIVIRHTSEHQVVAMVEIVSPGNKSRRHALRSFIEKAAEMVRNGIHLLIVDLFPPGPRDPEGIHKAIWTELTDNDFVLPADQPLTLAAYLAAECREAFVETTAVGETLPDMPLFLTSGIYVPVPLEATYRAAWEAVPRFWRNELSGGAAESA
ncbi:MAG: DUF4058 family protein [Planctomycetes bacterium]|nr:DUF4058 family protein [Planctomycetota bacterium]